MTRLIPMCAVLVGLAAGSNCAPESEPPDPAVPPDALDKRDLAGQWDYVVLGLGESSENSTCPSNRLSAVVWEINEDYIIARIPDDRGGWWPADEGTILGAWAIHHADYPPLTMDEWCEDVRCCAEGWCCECNLIWERDGLRPWYLRQYIRVDWSVNLAARYEVERMSMDAVTGEPVHYPPHWNGQDPPRIERNDAGLVISIEVVSQVLARASDCLTEQAETRSSVRALTSPCDFPWPSSCPPDSIRAYRQVFRKRLN